VRQIAGLLAGGVTLVAYPGYLAGIRRGEVQPAVASWCAWLLSAGIVAISQIIAGAGWSALLATAQMAGLASVTVAALAVSPWRPSSRERWCVALAVLGAGLGVAFQDPDLAVAAVILGNIIAGVPTYLSVWRSPAIEGRLLWFAGSAAGGLSVAAASTGGIAGQGYGWYLLITNGAVGLLALRRPGNTGRGYPAAAAGRQREARPPKASA
jgi:hypothetical protein